MQSGDRCRVLPEGDLGEIRGEPFEEDDGETLVSVFLDRIAFEDVPLDRVELVVPSIEEIADHRVKAQSRRLSAEVIRWWHRQAIDGRTDYVAIAREDEQRRARIKTIRDRLRIEIEQELRAALPHPSDDDLLAAWRASIDLKTDHELLGDDITPGEDVTDDEPGTRLRERAWRAEENERMRTAALDPTEARNLELEAAIDRDPSDASFSIYADWMQLHGNPRGQLIASDLAGAKTDKIRDEQFYAPLPYSNRFELTWYNGFIDSIVIPSTFADGKDGIDLVRIARVAGAATGTRFVRKLTISAGFSEDEQIVAQALAAFGPRPTLRELRLIANHDEVELSWSTGPDVDSLSAAYPDLETIFIELGAYDMTAPRFPKLRSLSLRTTNVTRENIAALVAAEWPVLETLELWFGSSRYNVELPLEEIAALLARPFPKLRSLSLSNGERTDELVAVILASPLLPQLDTLTIEMSTLADPQPLIAARDKLAHLHVLDVDDNYLTKPALAALQDALPQTRSKNQREDDVYEGVTYRYAAMGE
ncbi:MAG: hypothetical protein QM831_29810 [Kofleriaceae bacterium]